MGKLKRIVNISDISLKSPEKKGDKVVMKVDCMATTFRFTDTKPAAHVAAAVATPGGAPAPSVPGGAK